MTKDERDALLQIRKRLQHQRDKMPAHAEYVMGVANHGAGGAIEEAIKSLDELLGDEVDKAMRRDAEAMGAEYAGKP